VQSFDLGSALNPAGDGLTETEPQAVSTNAMAMIGASEKHGRLKQAARSALFMPLSLHAGIQDSEDARSSVRAERAGARRCAGPERAEATITDTQSWERTRTCPDSGVGGAERWRTESAAIGQTERVSRLSFGSGRKQSR